MKKRAWLFVVVAIVVVAAATVVLNFTLRGSRYDSAIPVRSEIVAKGRLEDRVTGNGSFKPRVSITVAAQVAGEVASVQVREGDRVVAGELLVSLREDDYRLGRERARASLDAARRGIAQSLVTLRGQYRSAAAAVEDARRALDRNQELFSAKAITEEVLQRSRDVLRNAELPLQSAREQLNLRCGYPLDAEPQLSAEKDAEIIAAASEVEQAELALRSAEDNLRKCVIAAPIAGTVTLVRPSVGDLAQPSTPLVRIESLEDMLAEIQVDEVDIGKIREGLAAEVSSDSLIGTTLAGVVESIAPTITSLGASRISLVEVRLVGVAGGGSRVPVLRAGASCSARIRANVREGVLLISLSAFVSEDQESFAFVLAPTGVSNRAGAEVYQLARRPIRLGASDVSAVEVLEGLTEGDRIATGGLKLLRDGIMVTAR